MRLSFSGLFYGWRVVAGAFVLAMFGWGIGFYGPSVFLHAVQERTGWSTLLVSVAVSVHFLVGALVVANLPLLYRSFGLPLVTKFAVTSLAVGVVGWALASAPWHLFLAACLTGAGWVAMSAAAVNAIISPWFVRGRPAALASAYNGASIGGVVFSPVWVLAIGLIGFPASALVICLPMVVIIFVLSDRVFARAPEDLGLRPDGDAAGAPAATVTSGKAVPRPGAAIWRDWQFLTLSVGSSLGLIAQIGLTAHLISLLVPALGSQGAGFALGLTTASALVGRSLLWLMPVDADRRLMAAMSYGLQVAGSIALIAAGGTSIPLILLGVTLFGLGFGNATSLPPLIAQVEFVRQDVARVIALNIAVGQASYAFAPAVFGLIREFLAGPTFFIISALFQALAVATLLAGRRR